MYARVKMHVKTNTNKIKMGKNNLFATHEKLLCKVFLRDCEKTNVYIYNMNVCKTRLHSTKSPWVCTSIPRYDAARCIGTIKCAELRTLPKKECSVEFIPSAKSLKINARPKRGKSGTPGMQSGSEIGFVTGIDRHNCECSLWQVFWVGKALWQAAPWPVNWTTIFLRPR